MIVHPLSLSALVASFLSFSLFRFFFSGGRIDHGHHDGSAIKALTDAVAMNKAVAKALQIIKKGKGFHRLDIRELQQPRRQRQGKRHFQNDFQIFQTSSQ